MTSEPNTEVNFYHIQERATGRTPVEVFQQLPGKQKAMLESSYQHEGKGMYSFLCTNPMQDISSTDQHTHITYTHDGSTKDYPGDALSYIKEHIPEIHLPIAVPFYGGLIGYVGYDAIRSYIHIGERKTIPFDMPDIHFLLFNTVIVFDHNEQVIHYIAIAYHNESMKVLEERVEKLKQSITPKEQEHTEHVTPLTFYEMEPKEQFIENVQHAQCVMEEQELEQIVLSKRFRAEKVKNAYSYYKKLRQANPSPYMFYLAFGAYTLFGASPESVVQTTGNQMIANPIAGTSPRGTSAVEDQLLKEHLLNDEKEIAEHNMLVELSKREVRSLCKPDSITVPIYQAVEMYEYVMHIVSKVQGTLRDDISSMDALMHCLPAGTVSGSPKNKAMALINAYEPTSRGVYGGAVGYINTAFDMNMVLAIRCMTVIGTDAYIQAGAGIVADSIPVKEYKEILHKARSLTSI